MKLLGENNILHISEDDGIVGITYALHLHSDLLKAKKMVCFRLNSMNHLFHNYPLISKIDGLRNSSKEAKLFLRSKESTRRFLATRVVSRSSLTNFFFNVFIKTWSPHLSIRRFQNYESAYLWTQKHKEIVCTA